MATHVYTTAGVVATAFARALRLAKVRRRVRDRAYEAWRSLPWYKRWFTLSPDPVRDTRWWVDHLALRIEEMQERWSVFSAMDPTTIVAVSYDDIEEYRLELR